MNLQGRAGAPAFSALTEPPGSQRTPIGSCARSGAASSSKSLLELCAAYRAVSSYTPPRKNRNFYQLAASGLGT